MHLSSASPRGEPRADVGEYGNFMGTLQQIFALVVGEMCVIFECPILGENNNKNFNFHRNAKSECLLIVQRTKIKFSSASSNPAGCLASPNTGDFARKKSPWVGKYKNFEMHNSKSPHISPGSPTLGEADDKCTNAYRKLSHSSTEIREASD